MPVTSQIRQTLRLDSAWRFHLGDIPAPIANKHIAAYMANKAGWARGAARPNFDDSDWRTVDLPHDWSVEGKFDPVNHVNSGFLPRGVGWYRRHFRLEESDRGKSLTLQFDGIATHCAVYVNGHCVHRHFCGYTPFTIDITDLATFGDQLNTIAVHVDAIYMEGWWYEGAGIYRHIWLIKTAPLHVSPWGVFVCPAKTTGTNWHTQIETTLRNDSDAAVTAELFSELRDPSGTPCGEAKSPVEIAARATLTIHQTVAIDHPALWSPQSPNLYTVRTEVRADGKVIDDLVTAFGYRTIRFDANEGLFLNDEHVLLKGTCNHQDHAGVGVAVPDSISSFRIQRLLDMGSNAYRCAHNPPATELLDACDRLGMLVMDENRNFGSSPEHLSQLRTMILRDRNHPSVILWSICNEESIQGTPVAAKITRSMMEAIEPLDTSRPVMAAVSGGILNDDCIASEIPVCGINYQPQVYEPFHAKHPHKPLIASETHCALSTRGTYKTDAAKFVFGSYDTEKAFWGHTARDAWREVVKRPFIVGLFAWTGFDYRGEPSPHEWPSVNSHWGILDTCGFAKDAFFLHRAWWTTEPFVHLLPHWNWPGSEGKQIDVMVSTNCTTVELFLNGQSLGRKEIDPIDMAHWNVAYEPGQLRAVGFRDGKQVAEQTTETTDSVTSLELEIHPSFDATTIPADSEFALPITVFATDSTGRRVQDAENLVTFSVEGAAKILGVGNGDPNCHEPDKASARSLFHGLAQVILQTTDIAGEIRLTATALGLRPARLKFSAASCTVRPSVPPAELRHFIPDWRMSPITTDRPDPNQAVADQDMNSWERFDPAQGAQQQWSTRDGFAVCRAAVAIPKVAQRRGGKINFQQIIGAAEIYIDGVLAATKSEPPGGSIAGPIAVPLPRGVEKITISALVRAGGAPGGISQPVELIPA